MMGKLWVRLTGAFLALALVTISVMAAVMNVMIELQFRGYLTEESENRAADSAFTRVQDFYAGQGSWEGVESVLPRGGEGSAGGATDSESESSQGHGQGFGQSAQRGGVRYTIIDSDGRIVYSEDEARTGQIATESDLERALPVMVDGETVGWLLAESPGQEALSNAQAQFLADVRTTLLVTTLVAGALALLIGFGFSRLLSRPLIDLTQAAQAVAAGKLGETVEVRTRHAAEITSLGESFNSMSQALAEGEDLRRRMTADIAHELRTPVSVMRARLQAIMDGIHKPTEENIATVYDQSLHLTRLVEDLRTLTRAESGHLPLDIKAVYLGGMLRQNAQMFETLADDAGVSLVLEIADGLPDVAADGGRLQQVLGNLLTNALRYCTAGGTIRLAARQEGDSLRVSVSNSGVTLTPEEARRVFERFWRADASRQRDTEGSGLGLSISQQIIRLHGGRIWVELSDDQTHFIFKVPVHRP